LRTDNSDWTRRSARDIAAAVREGRATVEEVASSTLERIASRAAIGAWAHIDPHLVLRNARAMDGTDLRNSPLAGMPVGIKDLMDTFDQWTSYGSPIYAGHRPAADAAIVARLREAGALVIGKTVTTEFAYRAAGATLNPHHAGHTPGGSSSGSAAAVADFQVPVATATQTSGSVIRPASFCGVVGFKPTYGELPATGVKPCAESLDTVGLIARSVADIAYVRRALLPDDRQVAQHAQPSAPKVGLCRTAFWAKADQAARERLEACAAHLQSAGARVFDLEPPACCDGLLERQRTILLFEMARNFAAEALRHRDLLSNDLRDALMAGRSISLDEYRQAQAHAERGRLALDALLAGCDFLLTLATPGEAPAGQSFTGDPIFNSTWTLLHVPCLALPAGKGPGGLPLGVQLVAARRQDEELLRWGAWAEATLSTLATGQGPAAVSSHASNTE
jgi:Asp-tRNA(Asn)/Glu-tRNA(Gln) amidotransferase A subunit family amidase